MDRLKRQKNEIKGLSAARQLEIVVLILGCVLISWLMYEHRSSVTFREDTTTYERIQSYWHSELVFCYDHDIKPCDDDAILQWNDDNPSDQFDYKSMHDLLSKE